MQSVHPSAGLLSGKDSQEVLYSLNFRPTYAVTEADSTHDVALTNSSTFHSRGVMFFQKPSNGGSRPSPLKPPYVCVPVELLEDIFRGGLYLGLFGDFNSYLL